MVFRKLKKKKTETRKGKKQKKGGPSHTSRNSLLAPFAILAPPGQPPHDNSSPHSTSSSSLSRALYALSSPPQAICLELCPYDSSPTPLEALLLIPRHEYVEIKEKKRSDTKTEKSK